MKWTHITSPQFPEEYIPSDEISRSLLVSERHTPIIRKCDGGFVILTRLHGNPDKFIKGVALNGDLLTWCEHNSILNNASEKSRNENGLASFLWCINNAFVPDVAFIKNMLDGLDEMDDEIITKTTSWNSLKRTRCEILKVKRNWLRNKPIFKHIKQFSNEPVIEVICHSYNRIGDEIEILNDQAHYTSDWMDRLYVHIEENRTTRFVTITAIIILAAILSLWTK